MRIHSSQLDDDTISFKPEEIFYDEQYRRHPFGLGKVRSEVARLVPSGLSKRLKSVRISKAWIKIKRERVEGNLESFGMREDMITWLAQHRAHTIYYKMIHVRDPVQRLQLGLG